MSLRPQTASLRLDGLGTPHPLLHDGRRLLANLRGCWASHAPTRRVEVFPWEVAALFEAGRHAGNTNGARGAGAEGHESRLDLERYVQERQACRFVQFARCYCLLTKLPKLTEEELLKIAERSPAPVASRNTLFARIESEASACGHGEDAKGWKAAFDEEFDEEERMLRPAFSRAMDEVEAALRSTAICSRFPPRGTILEAFPRPKQTVQRPQNPHRPSSAGRRMLSIDIKQANLTVAGILIPVMACGAAVEPFVDWEAYVKRVTGSTFMSRSKMFRQIAFGKAFKEHFKLIEHVERWMVDRVIDVTPFTVLSRSDDEVIFDLTGHAEETNATVRRRLSVLLYDWADRLHVNVFILRTACIDGDPKQRVYARHTLEDGVDHLFGVPPGKHAETARLFLESAASPAVAAKVP